MNDNVLLDFFIGICQSINYLHLKGFIYSDIKLFNIITSSIVHNEGYCVKFKDFATTELEKQEFWKDVNNEDYFKAPEILAGEKCSVLSDIYSLGILLFIVYINNKNCNFVINEQMKDFNECTLQEIF